MLSPRANVWDLNSHDLLEEMCVDTSGKCQVAHSDLAT